eukprot:7411345-Pyramimonas_sp.AAC.2
MWCCRIQAEYLLYQLAILLRLAQGGFDENNTTVRPSVSTLRRRCGRTSKSESFQTWTPARCPPARENDQGAAVHLYWLITTAPRDWYAHAEENADQRESGK